MLHLATALQKVPVEAGQQGVQEHIVCDWEKIF